MASIEAYPVAQIRLRESFYEQNGVLYPGDMEEVSSIPWVPEYLCNHEDQLRIEDEGARMCENCLSSWLCDWEVWLPAEAG